jgi:hypothetical protein
MVILRFKVGAKDSACEASAIALGSPVKSEEHDDVGISVSSLR